MNQASRTGVVVRMPLKETKNDVCQTLVVGHIHLAEQVIDHQRKIDGIKIYAIQRYLELKRCHPWVPAMGGEWATIARSADAEVH